MFIVFIKDLRNELQECCHRISIEDCNSNNVTFADDIALVCSSIAGLQICINICVAHSAQWYFKCNPSKSKCTTIGKYDLTTKPIWYLDNNVPIENVFFGLSDACKSYPGANASIEKHLRKDNYLPTYIVI